MRWWLAAMVLLAGCSSAGNIPVLEEAGQGGPRPVPAGCADLTDDVLSALTSGVQTLTVLTSPQGIEALRQGTVSFDGAGYRAALEVARFVEVTGYQDEDAGDAVAALDDAAERATVLLALPRPTHDDVVTFAESTGGPGQLLEHHQRLGAAITAACGADIG